MKQYGDGKMRCEMKGRLLSREGGWHIYREPSPQGVGWGHPKIKVAQNDLKHILVFLNEFLKSDEKKIGIFFVTVHRRTTNQSTRQAQ